MKKPYPTLERVRELLDYNQLTGVFRWKLEPLKGRIAGTIKKIGNIKYRQVCIDGKHLYMHRIAFLIMTGAYPTNLVDHKDGNGLNNIWSNLRPATTSQNLGNKARPITNTSGSKGVSFRKDTNRWRADIHENGKSRYLGQFNTKEQAELAYRMAATSLWGEYANFDR